MYLLGWLDPDQGRKPFTAEVYFRALPGAATFGRLRVRLSRNTEVAQRSAWVAGDQRGVVANQLCQRGGFELVEQVGAVGFDRAG